MAVMGATLSRARVRAALALVGAERTGSGAAEAGFFLALGRAGGVERALALEPRVAFDDFAILLDALLPE